MKKYKLRRLGKKIMLLLLRFLRRHGVEKYAITLVCCIIVLAIFNIHSLDRFELTLLDYRFAAKSFKAASNNIVLIDIAQDSIDQIGRWPWDRSWHAALITALKAFGAKAVFYDVIFSEPAEEKQDAALKTAIANAGNVYLPYLFNTEEANSQNPITQSSIYGIDGYMESLKEAAKGDGFINILPDVDGIVRRIPLIIEYKGQYHLQIAFKLACELLGVKKNEIVFKKGGYVRLPIKDKIPGPTMRRPAYFPNLKIYYLDIPIDNNYQMLINWPGTWKGGFKHFSFIDVIKSFRMITKGEKPAIPLESFNNKICVVGMGVSGLIDVKPTPIEPLYPAMGINACILDNILRADFCEELPRGFIVLFIFILAILTAGCLSIYHPLRDFLLTLILLCGYIAAAAILFSYFRIWINIVYPAAAALLTYIVLTLYNEVRINIEKKKLFALATIDSLTSLYQKGYFNAIMKTRFTDRRKDKKTADLSLIMADIDHFKNVNDTFGHLFGDFVLKRVAQTIKSICRPLDICGRYGGEEFIIMLPNTTLNEAVFIAERIRKTVEKKFFRYKKQVCRITISLGVTILKKEESQELLIQRADSALYSAKAQGRNKVCKG